MTQIHMNRDRAEAIKDCFASLVDSHKKAGQLSGDYSSYARLSNRCAVVSYFLEIEPVPPADVEEPESEASLVRLIGNSLYSLTISAEWVSYVKELCRNIGASSECCLLWSECLDYFRKSMPRCSELVGTLKSPPPFFWDDIEEYLEALQQLDFYSTFHCCDLGKRLILLFDTRPDVEVTMKESLHHANVHEFSRESVIYAALLHDVGKINVHPAVLTKPYRIEEGSPDWYRITAHCNLEGELGSKIKEIDDRFFGGSLLVSSYRNHHLHWEDKTKGYPAGVTEEDRKPLMGWLVAIVDKESAMATERVYRGSLAPRVILEEMDKDPGHHYPAFYAAWKGYFSERCESLDAKTLKPAKQKRPRGRQY